MIFAYLLVTLVALVLTVVLVRRRSRHAITAAAGMALGVLAILTGFSIGHYVALTAVAVLAVAAMGLRPRSRDT